jgi:putative membrane protein
MTKSVIAAVVAAVLLCTTTAFAADRATEKFIKEAIEGNLAEVQVGKLAQDKGQRADVKSFGQMLASDHSGAKPEGDAGRKPTRRDTAQ